MEETHRNIHCIFSSADRKRDECSPEPEVHENRFALNAGGMWEGGTNRYEVFEPTQTTELSRDISLVYKDSHLPFLNPVSWDVILCSLIRGFQRRDTKQTSVFWNVFNHSAKKLPRSETVSYVKRKTVVVAGSGTVTRTLPLTCNSSPLLMMPLENEITTSAGS